MARKLTPMQKAQRRLARLKPVQFISAEMLAAVVNEQPLVENERLEKTIHRLHQEAESVMAARRALQLVRPDAAPTGDLL